MDKAASGLLSTGLRKGDRLGMWGPNSYAWVLMQLATAQAGIILVRRGLPGTAGCGGGGIIQGNPLDPWPQNHTGAWLVSDQLVLSPEAHQGSLKVQGAASESGGAVRGTESAQDT